MQLRAESALLRALVDARAWKGFFLIDVGASGGIDPAWAAFGDTLKAVGFDPLIAEVDRLNREEQRPGVSYEAAFVSAPDIDRLFPPALRGDPIHSRTNDVFGRSSAVRATDVLAMDYVRDVFNRGEAKTVTERRVWLDAYVAESEYSTVDFVKVDTDGHDFEVLLGAQKLLREGGLGLLVEAQLHGSPHEYSNTFANIDRFLRDLGFSLFDFEVYRYSRGALPAPFVYDIPAQTETGQVLWGDAVYLRDLGDPLYEKKHPFAITTERVLKLAALFAMFGLSDCAAELFTTREAMVGDRLTSWLNLAARDAGVASGSYAAHIAAFDRNPSDFYPRARRRQAPPEPAPQAPDRVESAKDTKREERLVNALAENERLKVRLRELKEKNERLRRKLDERPTSAK